MWVIRNLVTSNDFIILVQWNCDSGHSRKKIPYVQFFYDEIFIVWILCGTLHLSLFRVIPRFWIFLLQWFWSHESSVWKGEADSRDPSGSHGRWTVQESQIQPGLLRKLQLVMHLVIQIHCNWLCYSSSHRTLGLTVYSFLAGNMDYWSKTPKEWANDT